MSLLTTVGRGAHPHPAAPAWFAVVGLVLGAALGGIWWAADRLWPPIVVAAIVVMADAALTGMIHLDGLADSADGLLPHLARDRRLEVMALPDVGAFGVTIVVATLLARFAALAALTPSPLLLAALWGLARLGMALGMTALPYARTHGIASAFASRPSRSPFLIVGALACLATAVAWHPIHGPVAVLAGAAAAASVLGVGHRRLGGYTGDVLGASGVAAETVGLLVAAARW